MLRPAPTSTLFPYTTLFRSRLRLPKGVLQRVAGVYERRWWKDPDNGWRQGVVLAAERAMAKAGIMRDQVGLLINASVSRQHRSEERRVGKECGTRGWAEK